MEGMTCDHCGKSTPRNGLVNWFEVDPIGIRFSTVTETTGPWHFDSLACLATWALERDNIRPAGVHQGGTDA